MKEIKRQWERSKSSGSTVSLIKYSDFYVTFLRYIRAFIYSPPGSLMLFNSAEKVLKSRASFNTFCLGKLEGNRLACEIHTGAFGLRWTWTLYCSGCWPASCSIYCGRISGLQSRRAWLAQEETAQPGMKCDNTHSWCFTLYYSLSLWVEAKMSVQGKRGETKRRRNCLEANNGNTRVHIRDLLQRWTGATKCVLHVVQTANNKSSATGHHLRWHRLYLHVIKKKCIRPSAALRQSAKGKKVTFNVRLSGPSA